MATLKLLSPILPLLALSLAAQAPHGKAPKAPAAKGEGTKAEAPKGEAPSAPAAKPDTDKEPTPEDLIIARATPYKPLITRDPFESPTDMERNIQGDLVDDVGVKGTTKINGKVMAVVSDSRGNVRWLPIGYRFKDGEIVAIDDKSVTFHQWDVNSTVRSAYRTVVKIFKREEGKR